MRVLTNLVRNIRFGPGRRHHRGARTRRLFARIRSDEGGATIVRSSSAHVALDRLGLSVAVRDHRPGEVARPARPVQSPTPTLRGHGLVLVEQLSRSWGVTTHDDGKTVWAIVDISSGEHPDPAAS